MAYNNCDDYSFAIYEVCESLNIDVEVCCGDLTCTDKTDHAWVRIYGWNFESTTLNLVKSPYCDYNTPYFVSNDRDMIINELW